MKSCQRFPLRLLTSMLGLAIALYAFCRPAYAQKSRRRAMEEAAAKIAEVMKRSQQNQLQLGDFSSAVGRPGNGAEGVRLDLEKALRALSLQLVEKEGAVLLTAKFRSVPNPDAPEKFIQEKVTFDLEDLNGDPLLGGRIVASFGRIEDIVSTEGVSLRLAPDDTQTLEERHRKLKQGIKAPTAFVEGTRVKSTPDSDYEVEIAVKTLLAAGDQKSLATPLKAQLVERLPHVNVPIGMVYEIRVHNPTAEEIAVRTTIDGIDMFTFSENRNADGEPRFTHMIAPPNQTIAIRGWHRTSDPKRDDNFASFLVTKLGFGAAAQLPRLAGGKQGLITVAISKSHKLDATGKGRARSSAETGFGPPVKSKTEPVRRLIDPPHDFISIRYAR